MTVRSGSPYRPNPTESACSPCARGSPAPDVRRRALLLACAGLALPFPSARAATDAADPAVALVRAFYDALLGVMKQADKLGLRGRYDKLAPVIRSTFDLDAMTRIAIGPDWTSFSPDAQKALIARFSELTLATYANRFNGFSGERFEVEPAAEARSTGRLVRTRLIQANGEPISLNYLMRGSDDRWRVVDVYLTGAISELATK